MLSVLWSYLDSIWCPRNTASWRTFPVGEVLTRVQLEPTLITGKRYPLVNIDKESFEYAIDGMLLIRCWWQTKTTVCDLYLYGICSYCICRELEMNLEKRWGSLATYSWTSQVSTHVIPHLQGTLPGHTNANMVWVSVKTARSCTVLTRRVIVLGMHTWHLPMLIVVGVQSQTQHLPTCLRHNLIISTQDFFKKKIADMCQHNMTRCYSCRNCWDGFPQCSCDKEPIVSDESESSDEDSKVGLIWLLNPMLSMVKSVKPICRHSKVSVMSTLLLPNLLQQKKNTLNRRHALIGWIGESGTLIGLWKFKRMGTGDVIII